MNLITLEPPQVEPVTLAEVQQFLRIDPFGSPGTHPDDDMLTSMIQAAREKVEQITRRSWAWRRYRLITDAYPKYESDCCGCWRWDCATRKVYLELPRSPVIAVYSIDYYDDDSELVTVAPTTYRVDAETLPGRVYLDSWPTDRVLRVDYTAGLAARGSPSDDNVTDIPAGVKQAIKFEVQLMYDELAPEKRTQIEGAVTRLLESYIVHTF